MNTIITIGRQFGSGGREIGKKVAEHFGIKFYDKDLLTRAAKESGFCEEMIQSHDERPTNSFLYNLVMDTYSFGYNSSSFVDMPISHKVFLAQFDTIKKIASEGPCVIVGRCADFVLESAGKEDLIKIFVYADTDTCIRRTMDVDGIVDTKEALSKLNRITKQRREYHHYFTGKEWEDVANYDLPINASRLELDQVVELIAEYIRMVGYDI